MVEFHMLNKYNLHYRVQAVYFAAFGLMTVSIWLWAWLMAPCLYGIRSGYNGTYIDHI